VEEARSHIPEEEAVEVVVEAAAAEAAQRA